MLERRAQPAAVMQPVDPRPGPVCGSPASGSCHPPGSDTDDADDSGTDDGLTVTRLDFEQALQLVRPVTLAA